MKLVLPSSGVLGLKSVEVRQPTFADLREMNNMNQEDGFIKFEFVKRLLDPHVANSPELLAKITKQDFDYIFTVAAFAMQFNSMDFTATCPDCGYKFKRDFTILNKELVMLDPKGYPFTREVNGISYTWYLLSAQDEANALNYAISQEDFQSAYEDAQVLLTFHQELKANSEFLVNLPPELYLSAFIFQQALFHGIPLQDELTCPKCLNSFKVRLSASADMVRTDVSEIIKHYSSVSDKISFEGFLSFTFPEYSAFIKSLNEQLQNS